MTNEIPLKIKLKFEPPNKKEELPFELNMFNDPSNNYVFLLKNNKFNDIINNSIIKNTNNDDIFYNEKKIDIIKTYNSNNNPDDITKKENIISNYNFVLKNLFKKDRKIKLNDVEYLIQDYKPDEPNSIKIKYTDTGDIQDIEDIEDIEDIKDIEDIDKIKDIEITIILKLNKFFSKTFNRTSLNIYFITDGDLITENKIKFQYKMIDNKSIKNPSHFFLLKQKKYDKFLIENAGFNTDDKEIFYN